MRFGGGIRVDAVKKNRAIEIEVNILCSGGKIINLGKTM